MIAPVSFSGIYDIRFPVGTKSEYIDQKAKEAKEFVEQQDYKIGDKPFVNVSVMDWFAQTKLNGNLAEKGIRIATSVDSPWLLCRLFDKLDKKLGQEYVNQTKVELLLDTQA